MPTSPSVRVVVQPGVPAARDDRLDVAGAPARADHPPRGGARDRRAGPICAAASAPIDGCSPTSIRALPGEPLIFVEVALTDDAHRHRTAARSRAGPRRAGVALPRRGLLLDLQLPAGAARHRVGQLPDQARRRGAEPRSSPSLSTFCTLSPVPTFAAWLRRPRTRTARPPARLGTRLRRSLAGCMSRLATGAPRTGRKRSLARLATLFAASSTAKDAAGKPLDAVARFHLGNGARLERVN